jgi:Ca2+-binding RTX toxin-like protein
MATIYGTNGADEIDSIWDGVSSAADTIFGLGGNDTIDGLGGNDTITGGFGADEIDGSGGVDTASYSDSDVGVAVNLATGVGAGGTAQGDELTSIENLTGSAHDDSLLGNDGVNVLSGGGDADLLKGAGGADTLNGDAGDDTLKGGGGADVINGGSGIDTVSYTESSARVVVSLNSGSPSGGDAEGDALSGVENLTGSAHNDVLHGDNGVNVLNGMDGNDSMLGWGGSDTLWGGEGNDTLNGMTGNDNMHGGDGDDTYFVWDAGDGVLEYVGEGMDTVYTAIDYTLGANVENLATDNPFGMGAAVYLTGNSLDNQISGNGFANTINGGAGSDIMSGGGGSDIYTVDNSGDSVVEAAAAGNDTVYALVNGYALTNNVEILSLNAGAALSGFGNSLDNDLYGNGLGNVLDGGGGADNLSGLGGDDTFAFVAGQAQGDTVWDFAGNGSGVGDLLKFTGYGTLAAGATVNDLVFV